MNPIFSGASRQYQIFSKRAAETKLLVLNSVRPRVKKKKEKARVQEPNGRSRRGG